MKEDGSLEYALFLGCTVPVRGMNYEASARLVAKRLEIQLVDIETFSCCGFPVQSVKKYAALLLAARNLSLAEQRGLDVCVLCSACGVNLAEANHAFEKDPDLLSQINSDLQAVGRCYSGKTKVKHFVRLLYQDVGLEQIKKHIRQPLSGLAVAPFYGCHYLKPAEVHDRFEDPEDPKSLEELIEITGAQALYYPNRMSCCGGGVLGIDEPTAQKIAKSTLDAAKAVGADALVLQCGTCDVMLELSQRKIGKIFEVEYNLPVVYYPQLLGLAMGIPQEELGFALNRVGSREFLERVNSLVTP
jgi:heterodisulfide reductase subunit B